MLENSRLPKVQNNNHSAYGLRGPAETDGAIQLEDKLGLVAKGLTSTPRKCYLTTAKPGEIAPLMQQLDEK
jgi:hypothetical protein